MREFTKPYDISKVVMPLSSLKLVDPATSTDPEGNYLTLSNYSSKRVASLLNMGSAQFSKKLYSLEPSIWSQLLSMRLNLNDIKEILSRNNAVVIDDTVVTVSEGESHVEDVVSSINQYIEDKNLKVCYHLYDKDMLVVIAVNSEGIGVLIKYYYQDNWVTIHDCKYDAASKYLLVSPYKELDTKVEEDIGVLMEKDVVMQTAVSTLVYSLESYQAKLQETYLSVDELLFYLKKYFKLKLTIEPIEAYDWAAERDDLAAPVVERLDAVLKKFYLSSNGSYLLINAPYLKRATTMTPVTYADLSSLLEAAFIMDGPVHINNLIDLQARALNRSSDYDSINS